MTDLAPASSLPTTDGTAELTPLSLLAVVAIALAFVAPIGGVVVGFIARHEVRRTSERGDGLAFAAILIGATLTLFTILVPAVLAVSGIVDGTINLWG